MYPLSNVPNARPICLRIVKFARFAWRSLNDLRSQEASVCDLSPDKVLSEATLQLGVSKLCRDGVLIVGG